MTARMEPFMSPLLSAERAFPNPFGHLMGQPLDDYHVDIAEINSEAFEACQRLIQDVEAGGSSSALTVFGDAGTGKTHLVGRVRRWLAPQPGHLFVFVRMETSPAGIWRHLRRHLALALLRADAAGARALDNLLEHRRGDFEIVADRDLSIVLDHLLEGRQARDCAAWLRGEGLPDEVLKSLQLSIPKEEEDPETTSRHIVKSICELIRPGVVVFCMDQIEAVMSSPGDRDGPHAFGKAVSYLIDETHNASVICCEQSIFVNLMEQILDGAAKARVLGRRAAIHPLSWKQAQQLICARLDTVTELAAERAAQGGCWPLAESQIREVFVDNAAPARKVIARSKDLFDLWRTGRAIAVEPLDTALQKMLEDRLATKDPAETEAILRNGLPLLVRSAGLTCSNPGHRPAIDFTIDGGRVAIAICNEANTRSLANRVRKIPQRVEARAESDAAHAPGCATANSAHGKSHQRTNRQPPGAARAADNHFAGGRGSSGRPPPIAFGRRKRRSGSSRRNRYAGRGGAMDRGSFAGRAGATGFFTRRHCRRSKPHTPGSHARLGRLAR